MPKDKAKISVKKARKAAQEKIHEGVEELKKILAVAKEKYDGMDDQTKKKIAAGAAGSIALIAGAIGISKMRKARKHK